MTKRPSLTAALGTRRSIPQQQPTAAAVAETERLAPQAPVVVQSGRGRQKARIGKTNFTCYGPPEAKYALEEVAIERKRALGRRVTLEELMFEAFNDFLMKEGRPALFPAKSD